jgi:peptide chain release factor
VTELLLSAGTAPPAARRLVAALAEALSVALPVSARAEVGPAEAPESVTLWVDGDAAAWVGVHAVLAARGAGRRRWSIAVRALPPVPVAPALDPRDVVVRACRASGPGGQAVNTTDAAVTAEHVPTGLRVRVQDERSQHANRRTALVRLAERVARAAAGDADAAVRARWRARHDVRGAPVSTWRERPDGRLEATGGTTDTSIQMHTNVRSHPE